MSTAQYADPAVRSVPCPSYGPGRGGADLDRKHGDLPVSTCTACGTDLVLEPSVGWVDEMTGDEGGTYDHCTESADRRHQPNDHPAP